jgi:hypothetical protein
VIAAREIELSRKRMAERNEIRYFRDRLAEPLFVQRIARGKFRHRRKNPESAFRKLLHGVFNFLLVERPDLGTPVVDRS